MIITTIEIYTFNENSQRTNIADPPVRTILHIAFSNELSPLIAPPKAKNKIRHSQIIQKYFPFFFLFILQLNRF